MRTYKLDVTSATHIGGRAYQEDRIAIEEAFEYYAVFDGHAGREIAEKAASVFPELVATFDSAELSDLVAELVERTRLVEFSGSTATIARVRQTRVEYAVLGDSPIAVLHKNGIMEVGPNHNVRTNLKERQAGIMRGGTYSGGYLCHGFSGLQMSRALGDWSFGDVINRIPEVGEFEFLPGDRLLLATDGVLYEDQELYRLFNFQTAEEVVQDALKRKTHDNVSAIMVNYAGR